MIIRFVKIAFLALLLVGAAGEGYAQSDASEAIPGRGGRRLGESMDLKAMLAKQRLERDKKDHRDMIERGEQALRLAKELEASFSENKNLSSQDKARLESLETVVEKIRKELGASDDDGYSEREGVVKPVEEHRPSTLEEAFKYLQTSTVQLVDELKKTTRFTISAVAIQSSNSVLRLVKFLRLRK
jgi:hypothetical protein